MDIGRSGVYWESTSVKSERPDLVLTIARLVRSATPVTPLEPPSIRVTRWAISSAGLALVGASLLGIRADVAAQLVDGWFLARVAATLAIALTAAALAFFSSVPGVEPSRGARALPFAMCIVWGAMLIEAIAATQSPADTFFRVRPHLSCVLLIAGIGLPSGAMLVRMLRHAAPLQPRWAGAFAGLASLALGALGAQFVCTNDAAAHHLVWHFIPVALLTLTSVAAGPSLFHWSHRGRRAIGL